MVSSQSASSWRHTLSATGGVPALHWPVSLLAMVLTVFVILFGGDAFTHRAFLMVKNEPFENATC